MNRITLVLILFFKSTSTTNLSHFNQWVVWNVGQGQWVTHSFSDYCLHYDLGGEVGSYFTIQSKLKKLCYSKKNALYLSHWDFDHYVNITYFVRNFPEVCWLAKPLPTIKKSKIQIQIENLPLKLCSLELSDIKIWIPQKNRSKNKNDKSLVALDSNVLLPGDSPIQQEKKWIYQFPFIQKTKFLILGHHGSKTSTGKLLIQKLTNLKQAISSARYKKYKHPHSQVLKRLKKTPVLKTEDWGNIWFETIN